MPVKEGEMKRGDLVKVRAEKIPSRCTRLGVVVKMRMRSPRNQNITFRALVKWMNGNMSYMPQLKLEVISG